MLTEVCREVNVALAVVPEQDVSLADRDLSLMMSKSITSLYCKVLMKPEQNRWEERGCCATAGHVQPLLCCLLLGCQLTWVATRRCPAPGTSASDFGYRPRRSQDTGCHHLVQVSVTEQWELLEDKSLLLGVQW